MNTIVAIAPILYTSFAEATPLIPLTILQKNKSIPIYENLMSYLDEKKYEIYDLATNAPP